LQRQVARKSYTNVRSSVVLQAGMRTMAARYDFNYKRKKNAASTIQVAKSLFFISWLKRMILT
jgi:hypothetical protein